MWSSALKADELERAAADGTDCQVPDHVDVEYAARLEPRPMRLPKFIERTDFIGGGIRGKVGVKTLFGADDRKGFFSTAYPWRCVGKVESALGSGSGVMVGPRHLLTCSHIFDWKADGSAGWIKFTPMYYNGNRA